MRDLDPAIERVLALTATGRVPSDPNPKSLKLRDINVEEALFQPRDNLDYTQDSDRHVDEMANALRISPEGQKVLEPIIVVSFGEKWFCIDGHHRLRAYTSAAVFDTIPVTVFTTLAEGATRINVAVRRSTELNIREKLPMTNDDKFNSAWRLCIVGGASKQQLAMITTLSQRTIATMRKVLGILRERIDPEDPTRARIHSDNVLYDLSWRKAFLLMRNVAPSPLGDYDDRMEEMAVEMAARLRKTFDLRLDLNPAVTARALSIYSGRLPGRLIYEWGQSYQTEGDEDDGSNQPDD